MVSFAQMNNQAGLSRQIQPVIVSSHRLDPFHNPVPGQNLTFSEVSC